MLDPQTRQQLQTKFQQVKPQLKSKFSGVTTRISRRAGMTRIS
jgi:hypothetical protein